MSKHIAILALALAFIGAAGASPAKTYFLYAGASGGATFNLGGAAQVAGPGVGLELFENGDYFEDIGRYHLTLAPRASLMLQFRPDPKDAFTFGFARDKRALVFDFRKRLAPTDLTFASDFDYYEYSVSYARSIGTSNGYIGLGWQYNQLIANDSRIEYDGNDYRSVLADATDSESISLFFGKHIPVKGGAIDAKVSLYADTTLTYPEHHDGYIVWLMFMGISLDFTWLQGVF